MTTLIFPSTHCEAKKYYREAKAHGERVVCASKHNDWMCEDWVQLPDIYDPKFLGLMMQLIIDHHIHKIHTDSATVYEKLKPHFPSRMLPPPSDTVQGYYGELFTRAGRIKSHMEIHKVAALLKGVDGIYGESSHDKIASIIEIFSDMPEGAAVEIGALFGKTAWLIGTLAGRIHVIDTWNKHDALQADVSSHVWDWDAMNEAFNVNMAFIDTVVNQNVPSEIALLHIDGNHDYAHVKSDWEKYGGYIVSGGWLVLDDYEWAHGDGPWKVGDEILQHRNIDRHFVSGGALFVKFK